jgi:hypothetical protein
VSARAAFKQADVERLIRGVKATGLPVAEVVYEGGRVRVLIGEESQDNEDWRKGSPLYKDAA